VTTFVCAAYGTSSAQTPLEPGLPSVSSPSESQTASASPVHLGGFLAGLLGYTYGDPSHWSRGVVRGYLEARGRLAQNVSWKLSGRADADIVYFTSNYYPDAVKRDQRADFFWGENYLDFSAGDWDFRVGAQNIVWGEVVGLFFADVVSARDMREFLLPPFDVIRIPQWAARAEYTWNDSHVELVWIPVPVFDNIGKPGSDFYPVPLPAPPTEATGTAIRNPVKPERTISNGNYGIRANTLVEGWDLAAFFYRSYSAQPTFYAVPSEEPALRFQYEPRYDRIWQAGGTVTKDLGEVVLRSEAVYTRGQGQPLADPIGGDGVVKRPTFDWIASVEWPFAVDSRLNVQLFQRWIDGGDDDLAIKSGGFGASVFLSYRLDDRWEPQILYIQSFADAGGLFRPRLNWYPAKNWAVGFGVDIFSGPSDGYFGRYDEKDRVYAEFRYTF